MGFIDSLPFSFGSFAILDDLTDCSSETVTYVERRRSSSSQDKAKSKSKQSTTTPTRAREEHVTNRHGSAAPGAGAVSTVKGPETARSTTVANLNVKEEDVRLRGAATNVSAKRSVANETIAKRSTVTAPAAPGREPSRRPRHEKREEEREQKASAKKEEVKQDVKKEETNIEVITTSKGTVRSVSRSQIKSREPSHAPQPSEAETRPDVSSEELRKEKNKGVEPNKSAIANSSAKRKPGDAQPTKTVNKKMNSEFDTETSELVADDDEKWERKQMKHNEVGASKTSLLRSGGSVVVEWRF